MRLPGAARIAGRAVGSGVSLFVGNLAYEVGCAIRRNSARNSAQFGAQFGAILRNSAQFSDAAHPPSQVTWQALKDHFKTAGDVLKADVMMDDATGRSKGCGIVKMASAQVTGDSTPTAPLPLPSPPADLPSTPTIPSHLHLTHPPLPPAGRRERRAQLNDSELFGRSIFVREDLRESRVRLAHEPPPRRPPRQIYVDGAGRQGRCRRRRRVQALRRQPLVRHDVAGPQGPDEDGGRAAARRRGDGRRRPVEGLRHGDVRVDARGGQGDPGAERVGVPRPNHRGAPGRDVRTARWLNEGEEDEDGGGRGGPGQQKSRTRDDDETATYVDGGAGDADWGRGEGDERVAEIEGRRRAAENGRRLLVRSGGGTLRCNKKTDARPRAVTQRRPSQNTPARRFFFEFSLAPRPRRRRRRRRRDRRRPASPRPAPRWTKSTRPRRARRGGRARARRRRAPMSCLALALPQAAATGTRHSGRRRRRSRASRLAAGRCSSAPPPFSSFFFDARVAVGASPRPAPRCSGGDVGGALVGGAGKPFCAAAGDQLFDTVARPSENNVALVVRRRRAALLPGHARAAPVLRDRPARRSNPRTRRGPRRRARGAPTTNTSQSSRACVAQCRGVTKPNEVREHVGLGRPR